MQISCHRAGKQHGQGHEARAKGIVGGLERTLRKTHHINRVGRKAVAVTKLVEDDAGADRPYGRGLHQRKKQIHRAGQGQTERHRKQALTEAPAGNVPAAEDAAGEKGDDTGRPVHHPVSRFVHSESADLDRVAEKRIQQLDGQCFRKTIQQQEKNQQPDSRLREKAAERFTEFRKYLSHGLPFGRTVVIGTRKDKGVIQRNGRQNNRSGEQRDAPRTGHDARPLLQPAGQNDQNTLPEHHRNAVERVSDAHKGRLPPLVQADHVESVRRDVMRRGSETGDDEQDQGPGERRGRGKSDRQQGDGGRHQQLHRHNPPALALENVHERAPERLDKPGKADQAGQEGQPAVVHPQVLEDDDGDRVDDKIRKAFRKIQGGNPQPGRACFHRSRVVPG